MEFLLIMGIGTVLAVLVVIGSRPKRPVYSKGSASLARRFSPGESPVWKKDAAASHPIGELEYLEDIKGFMIVFHEIHISKSIKVISKCNEVSFTASSHYPKGSTYINMHES